VKLKYLKLIELDGIVAMKILQFFSFPTMICPFYKPGEYHEHFRQLKDDPYREVVRLVVLINS